MSALNISRSLGVALLGLGALAMSFRCLQSIMAWVMELHFYWQAGWNFALPTPVHSIQVTPVPAGLNAFHRILIGWPISIAGYAGLALVTLRFAKFAQTAEPNLQTPPLHKSPFFWLAVILLMAIVALMAFWHFAATSMAHH